MNYQTQLIAHINQVQLTDRWNLSQRTLKRWRSVGWEPVFIKLGGRAIDHGVSKERLARTFNVNLSSINQSINLLEGICPEAIKLLQDHQFTPDVTCVLRNMKAAR